MAACAVADGVESVYVVDDDRASRDGICALLSVRLGIQTIALESAAAFLSNYDPSVIGCLVSDYKMAGMNGLELQREIARRGIAIPIVFISGFADVHVAVQAMRSGAVTLLEKPLQDDELVGAVGEAIRLDRSRRSAGRQRSLARHKLSRLTSQEMEVVAMIIEGKSNKKMSSALDVSLRTVERRRQSIFNKTETTSAVELARLIHETKQTSD